MSIRPIKPEQAALRSHPLTRTCESVRAEVTARLILGTRIVRELEARGFGMTDMDARELLTGREVRIPVATLANLLDVEVPDTRDAYGGPL